MVLPFFQGRVTERMRKRILRPLIHCANSWNHQCCVRLRPRCRTPAMCLTGIGLKTGPPFVVFPSALAKNRNRKQSTWDSNRSSDVGTWSCTQWLGLCQRSGFNSDFIGRLCFSSFHLLIVRTSVRIETLMLQWWVINDYSPLGAFFFMVISSFNCDQDKCLHIEVVNVIFSPDI